MALTIEMDQNASLMWLNKSVITINTTFQLLDIDYKL